MSKFKLDDLELAIKHIRKTSNMPDVDVEFDQINEGSLVLKTYDRAERRIDIRLYLSEQNIFPKITQTSILTKDST